MEKMVGLLTKLRLAHNGADPEVRAALDKMQPTMDAIAKFVEASRDPA